MVPSSDDHTPDADRPLGKVAARGARLALLGWGLSQGLTFAAYIVLAHLISPRAFGTFTAGSILITFGVLFAESGTMAALISRRDRIDEAASTAFFSLLAGGILLAVLSLAASPLVRLFFHNPTAGSVAAALSAWLLLRAMTIVPDSLLQRRFSYARRVAVDPLGAIAFAAASIIACASGAGVWGLVAGTYASEIVEVAAAWAFVRFRPRWRLASMEMWRDIAVFARPVLGSEILRRIASQMDVLMLGRFTNAGTLGQYRNGYRLASQPGQAFVDVGAYVLLPTLAHISRDAARLGSVIRRVYGVAMAASVPVSLAMIPLGVPIAVLFLGERWRPAGHVIAVLGGLLLGGAISSVAAECSKAIGRPGLLVRIHGLNLAVTAVLVIAAVIPFGLLGAAGAVSASQVVVGLYAFHQVASHIGMGWRDLAAELISPLVASGAMVAAMVAYAIWVDPLGHGTAVGFLLTGIQVVLGAAVYLGALSFIDPRRRDDLRGLRRRRRPTDPGYA
ncbi:MAG TPA: oligosaccharide flippase family protein [Solirubrobacteraceae bacterium]